MFSNQSIRSIFLRVLSSKMLEHKNRFLKLYRYVQFGPIFNAILPYPADWTASLLAPGQNVPLFSVNPCRYGEPPFATVEIGSDKMRSNSRSELKSGHKPTHLCLSNWHWAQGRFFLFMTSLLVVVSHTLTHPK